MSSFRKLWKWMCFGIVALAASRLYYVQELVAALIIFSIVFSFLAVFTLFLLFLDRASLRTLAWAERSVNTRSLQRLALDWDFRKGLK